MIPQTVLAGVVAPVARAAAVFPAVVGDPRATVYDARVVSGVEEESRRWYKPRTVLMLASWERKRKDGEAGFFASAQEFPGL